MYQVGTKLGSGSQGALMMSSLAHLSGIRHLSNPLAYLGLINVSGVSNHPLDAILNLEESLPTISRAVAPFSGL